MSIYLIDQAKSESKIYILFVDLDREESGAYKEIRATSQNARQQRGNLNIQSIHYKSLINTFNDCFLDYTITIVNSISSVYINSNAYCVPKNRVNNVFF